MMVSYTNKLWFGVAVVVLLGMGVYVTFNSSSITPFERSSFDSDSEYGKWRMHIQEKGAESAYAAFRDQYSSAGDEILAHEAAHIFGEALWSEMEFDGIGVCDGSFGFGCYHTFFLSAVRTHGPDVIFQLDAVCVEKFGSGGGGCMHGIGHGLLVYYGADRVQEALDQCARLSWQEPLLGCQGGVFMEYFFPSHPEEDGRPRQHPSVHEERPFEFCFGLSERFHYSCIYEQSNFWVRVSGGRAAQGELCELLAYDSHRETCYLGLGRGIAEDTRFHLEDAKEQCALMPHNHAELLCLAGAAFSFWDGGFPGAALTVCETLSEGERRQCLEKADFLGFDIFSSSLVE